MLSKNAVLFAGTLLLLSGALALASLSGEPQGAVASPVSWSPGQRVEPAELSEWIITGKRDFVVVDVRAEGSVAAGSIRDAVRCGSCHGSAEEGCRAMGGAGFVDLSKKVVFLTETGREAVVVPKILLDNPRLHLLRGGFAAWQAELLNEPPTPDPGDDTGRLQALRRQGALRRFHLGLDPIDGPATGQPTGAPPAAAQPAPTPSRRVNAHRPGKLEGC
ncbi:MAG: hypothetical protein FJ125_12620 [Deltaproteobacteria bacterium]|nr:hypothetical protein [Deltaproteobacteria bacterium]